MEPIIYWFHALNKRLRRSMKIRVLITVVLFSLSSIVVLAEEVADTIKAVGMESKVEFLLEKTENMQKTLDNQEQTIIEIKKVSDESSLQSLPILLSVVSFVVAVIALVLLLKNGKNFHQVKEEKIEKAQENGVIYLQKEIRRLEGELTEVTRRITKLEMISNQKKKNVPNPPQSSIFHSPTQQHSQPKQLSINQQNIGGTSFTKVVKYAESLEGDSILVDDLKDANSEYALIKVTLISPTEASFEVNDMAQAQPMLVSSYKFTIANFVNSSSSSTSPKLIRTRNAGVLRLHGDRWKLERKADIVLE